MKYAEYQVKILNLVYHNVCGFRFICINIFVSVFPKWVYLSVNLFTLWNFNISRLWMPLFEIKKYMFRKNYVIKVLSGHSSSLSPQHTHTFQWNGILFYRIMRSVLHSTAFCKGNKMKEKNPHLLMSANFMYMKMWCCINFSGRKSIKPHTEWYTISKCRGPSDRMGMNPPILVERFVILRNIYYYIDTNRSKSWAIAYTRTTIST